MPLKASRFKPVSKSEEQDGLLRWTFACRHFEPGMSLCSSKIWSQNKDEAGDQSVAVLHKFTEIYVERVLGSDLDLKQLSLQGILSNGFLYY